MGDTSHTFMKNPHCYHWYKKQNFNIHDIIHVKVIITKSEPDFWSMFSVVLKARLQCTCILSRNLRELA